MWPDRVSNTGPLTYESGAIPTALRGLAGTVLHPYCTTRILVYHLSIPHMQRANYEISWSYFGNYSVCMLRLYRFHQSPQYSLILRKRNSNQV